eukprot:c47112_g1_i1.p1 GENE.c47112_g1_i1~~c47112_g1_i1.p1  ORF type:complete len:303 (+),score=52.11 c47112_g1_i1:97-1005(+)
MAAEAEGTMPFRILSLNVKQFPTHMAYFAGAGGGRARIDRLVATVRATHDEYELLAIQEMWSPDMCKVFCAGVSDLYPHIAKGATKRGFGFGLGSGLVILSKAPIERATTHTFRNIRGPEHFASKGLLGVQVRAYDRTVVVFTTHLQAGAGGSLLKFVDRKKPSTAELSGLELGEVREAITAFIISGETPDARAPALVVLAGDLNIKSKSVGELAAGIEALGGVEAVRDTIRASDNNRSSTWNNLEDGERIDYILHLQTGPWVGGAADEAPVAPVRGDSFLIDSFGADITDHKGLVGAFWLL